MFGGPERRFRARARRRRARAELSGARVSAASAIFGTVLAVSGRYRGVRRAPACRRTERRASRITRRAITQELSVRAAAPYQRRAFAPDSEKCERKKCRSRTLCRARSRHLLDSWAATTRGDEGLQLTVLCGLAAAPLQGKCRLHRFGSSGESGAAANHLGRRPCTASHKRSKHRLA